MNYKQEFIGESLGTFLLVLLGCGSMIVSTLFGLYHGILQIALSWGVGISLSIYLVRQISCAHLNPAVSIAMVLSKRMLLSKLPTYILAQFIGALIAGLTLYLLFNPFISNYESVNGILRGSVESIETARMFGEFYAYANNESIITMPIAMIAEAFGTFLFIILIFALTKDCKVGSPENALAPLFIGLAATSIICLIAPLTQAGLNPARDFGPRMITWIFGWDSAAFPDMQGGFFWVYILAPIIGGALAAFFYIKVMEPASQKNRNECGCGKKLNTKSNE